MAAPKFLFSMSEFILCNIFSPFFFSLLSLSLLMWDGADAFQLIFKVQVLNGIPIQRCSSVIHPVVVLQNKGPLWCGWNGGPSICHPTALAESEAHLDLWCMSSQSVSWLLCGSKTSAGVMKYKRIISDESNLRASREAAVRCDNTVLLMLYKWRDLF